MYYNNSYSGNSCPCNSQNYYNTSKPYYATSKPYYSNNPAYYGNNRRLIGGAGSFLVPFGLGFLSAPLFFGPRPRPYYYQPYPY